MANIVLLNELLMFAKTSGRKMTVKDAVEEYYFHYLEDCRHTPSVMLISEEKSLRGMLGSTALDEDQKFLVCDLLQEIGLAKAEEAAMLKDCVGPEGYGEDCSPHHPYEVLEEVFPPIKPYNNNDDDLPF